MDKKVWAIVGIIALHLALMFLFRGTLKPEEMARAAKTSHPDSAPIEPNPYLAPIVPISEPSTIAPSAATEQLLARAAKKPQRNETVSRKNRIRRDHTIESRNAFENIRVQRATITPPVFQDTVIFVKVAEVRPIYLAEKKVAAETKAVPAARIAPIKKKKPFFKRTVLPVIRKPYDWIKTLVSKL